jgi:hypothetical protein
MKLFYSLALACILAYSCRPKTSDPVTTTLPLPIIGTWQLETGTLIEKGDTTVTDYSKDKSFIKIINSTHFAFLLHDLKKGKDSTGLFSAGGGRYTLVDDKYIEHLEYCSDRAWEGHDFEFTLTVTEDSFIQRGIEKIESEGIDRINIEKYKRVKN